MNDHGKHQAASIRRRVADERGVALVGGVLLLTAFLAMTVVAVDVGRIAFTATEVQNAADIAASAGARDLKDNGTLGSDAATTLAQNTVEGQSATAALQSLDAGTYNFTNQSFTVGGASPNAVRAIAQATVNNVFAGVNLADLGVPGFNSPTSTVTKNAIAAFGGLGSGTPNLPLALGDCAFPGYPNAPDCFDPSCLPTLTQIPDGSDNSAWTGFFLGANSSTLVDYFPPQCQKGQPVNQPFPNLNVGDTITLQNGQDKPTLEAVECLFNLGMTEFLVPVVTCDGQLNQDSTVLGFVTVRINNVVVNPPANRGIYLDAIINTAVSGPPGGQGFGTPGGVRLVS